MTRSIQAEITISDGTRRRKLDFGIHQASPRKWRGGDWRGHGASDFTTESEARKALADKLRTWADHIQTTPFPKDPSR